MFQLRFFPLHIKRLFPHKRIPTLSNLFIQFSHLSCCVRHLVTRKPFSEYPKATEQPNVRAGKRISRKTSRGVIHSTKIHTSPTGKRGPPQKVDQFFRNFSRWTERVLDRNFRNLVEWIAPTVSLYQPAQQSLPRASSFGVRRAKRGLLFLELFL